MANERSMSLFRSEVKPIIFNMIFGGMNTHSIYIIVPLMFTQGTRVFTHGQIPGFSGVFYFKNNGFYRLPFQWPFQVLEVRYHIKAYFRGIFPYPLHRPKHNGTPINRFLKWPLIISSWVEISLAYFINIFHYNTTTVGYFPTNIIIYHLVI